MKLVLELGSGAGFISDFIPNLITAEIFYCSDNPLSDYMGFSLPFRATESGKTSKMHSAVRATDAVFAKIVLRRVG